MDARPLPIRTPERSPDDVERDLRSTRAHDQSLLGRRLAPFAGDTTTVRRVAIRERMYRRSLALSDMVSAVVGCLIAVAIPGTASTFEPAALVLIPILILSAKLLGLYDRDEVLIRKTTAEEVPALLQLSTMFALIIWLGSSVFLDESPSREQVLALWGVLFVLLVISRWLVRQILARAIAPERCLVVGGTTLTERFSAKLKDNGVNARVVGRLAIDEVAPTLARFGPQEFTSLATSLTELHVDRVVVAPEDGRPELTLDLIRAVKTQGVRVSVLPHTMEVVGSAVTYDDLFGMPVLGVRRFGLTRSSQFVKRVTDIVISSVLLLATAPFFVVAAILIKLSSPGPVLFTQDRMGRDGHMFRMFKFRTMVDDAEGQKDALREKNQTSGLFKIADDPRITRVGRPLRSTSLDELPQLINVLKGDMSMVGPRPLVPDEDAQIKGLDRKRLTLPPGVTGPWQILGSARVPLSEMVKIDYLYAANWSAWNDIKIMMRTVVYVLKRGGM